MKKRRTPPPSRGKALEIPPPADSIAWVVALVSGFALLALLATRYLGDTDLGYHLKGGQWILANRAFLSHDVYTYTRSSAAYLDLHWLYQVLIYAVYRAGGYVSLSLLNIALIAAVRIIQLVDARDGSSRPAMLPTSTSLPPPKSSDPRSNATRLGRKTHTRPARSPGFPGSSPASEDGIATTNHPALRRCEWVGTNSPPWQRSMPLLSLRKK